MLSEVFHELAVWAPEPTTWNAPNAPHALIADLDDGPNAGSDRLILDSYKDEFNTPKLI